MAFTAGLLSFLGVEALAESFELQAALPAGLGGAGLVLLGRRAQLPRDDRARAAPDAGPAAAAGFTLALLVAVGIGLHNLGEGLAIGASFSLGELQLGAFLIVGFMIHNVTEGLAIATPVAKARVDDPHARRSRARRRGSDDPRRLARRVHVERSSSPRFFFAIAAGAAFQVVVEVGRYVARHAPGGLRSGHVIAGFLAGLATMFVTGVLVGLSRLGNGRLTAANPRFTALGL